MELLSSPLVVGGIAGGLAVLIYALFQPRRNCPKCKQLLPLTRAPKTTQEALLGGWHCPKCNAQLVRKGRLISG